MSYLIEAVGTKVTPQSEPIPGENQVKNNAGGFVYEVGPFKQLERFLILGSEGGTYYAGERDHTKQNLECVRKCLDLDAHKTLGMIRDVSVGGRAAKNDQAIAALSMAASYKVKDPKDTAAWRVRADALAILPDVCRIGTHLYQFVSMVETQRGWGRGLKNAVAKWFTAKPAQNLGYQLAKYQQRDGWSSRDLMRLSHPKTADVYRNSCLHWSTKNHEYLTEGMYRSALANATSLLYAVNEANAATEVATIIRLITDYHLTREMIPTQWLDNPRVWDALLSRMPLTAMIRNLGKMSQVGLLTPMSVASLAVQGRLQNENELKNARVHPIQILSAMLTYKQGHGFKGKLTWTPVPQIIDRLDKAFYLSFQNAPSTGKRLYIGLDISGSMDGSKVNGIPFLDARMGSGAMAMVLAKTEPNYYCAGFTAGGSGHWGSRDGTLMRQIVVSQNARLDQVCEDLRRIPMGGTDCSLPMLDALNQKMPIDVFLVITDNETWAGRIHPSQALRQYRDKMGIPAKMIVMAMTSTGFTIADPADAGMLDVVGFDTAVPRVMADFISDGVAAVETKDETEETSE